MFKHGYKCLAEFKYTHAKLPSSVDMCVHYMDTLLFWLF